MAKRRTKGISALPRGVRRIGRGYQAWAMIDGRRVWSRVVPTVDVAEKIATRMRESDATIPDVPRTLQDAFDLILTDPLTTKGTKAHYRSHIRAVTPFLPGNTLLPAIKPTHIATFKESMLAGDRSRQPVSGATVNRRLSLLRRAFTMATERGWMDSNPASERAVSRPTEREGQVDFFEEVEFRNVLQRVLTSRFPERRRHAYWMAVVAMTGLRRTEFARSRIAHWNLAGQTLFVEGKTANRHLPFSPDLVPYVQWLTNDSPDGLSLGPASADTISGTFRVWAERLGERRLHCHALRHTYGTSLVRAGHDIETIRVLMGHKSLTTTRRYFHASGIAARNAAASLRLLPPDRESGIAEPA